MKEKQQQQQQQQQQHKHIAILGTYISYKQSNLQMQYSAANQNLQSVEPITGCNIN